MSSSRMLKLPIHNTKSIGSGFTYSDRLSNDDSFDIFNPCRAGIGSPDVGDFISKSVAFVIDFFRS